MKIEEYFKILILVNFIIGLILNPVLSIIGITLLGIDYIIWGMLFLQVFIITIYKNKFKILIPRSYRFILLLIIMFVFFNFFSSDYVINARWYIIGTLFTLIIPITFILSYNIVFSERTILKLIASIVSFITLIFILIYFESYFIHHSFEKLQSDFFLKNLGFAGTLGSINIALSLVLYKLKRMNIYILIISFSFLTIVYIGLLKAIFSSLLIITLFVILFHAKRRLKKTAIAVFITAIIFIVFLSVNSLQDKASRYLYLYMQSDNVDKTPRVALYIASFNIAKNEFPFGSGQSTFGSFPVNITYNNIYHDYGLSNLHGLQYKASPNFLFDSYWSSIIGEMGFICAILYFILHIYPMLYSKKYLKDENLAPFAFIVLSTTLIIVIESITLAIPYQVSFIIIYSSLNGIIFRLLKKSQEA